MELFNTGPDLNVFLPTLVSFVVLLSAISYIIYIIYTIRTSNTFIKKLTIYINLFQSISFLLIGLISPGIAKVNER
jgi:hypothetical protein